jgi:MFS family permease
MGQFLTLYAIEKVNLRNSGVQMMLLVVPMLAQLIVLPAWGKAADRMGKKPLLVLATLGLVPVGVGWCLLTAGNVWLGFVLAAAGTVLWTGVEIANFNLVLEFSGNNVDQGNGSGAKNGGSAYHAVNSLILNMAAVLGGLTWGAIAQWLKDWKWTPVGGMKTFTSYDVLFLLSGVLRLAAVVIFLPHIKEPKARPTREALRFMGSNIYNNLFNAVLQPLRMIRPKRAHTYDPKAKLRRAA